MPNLVEYINSFQNFVADCKTQLAVNDQQQELLDALAKLTEYETVILQRFRLLIDIDPNIEEQIIDQSFRKIQGRLAGFLNGYMGHLEADKFTNPQTIKNYKL